MSEGGNAVVVPEAANMSKAPARYSVDIPSVMSETVGMLWLSPWMHVLAFKLSLARTVEHLMSPDKVLNDAQRGDVPSEPARRLLGWTN